MNRIISTMTAAVLATGVGLMAPAAASAVPTNVVTSSKFARVTQGNSVDYVRTTFGSNGTVLQRRDVPGTANDYVRLEFPTYYPGGTVEVEFHRRSSGTWYLVSKYALWGNSATRTTDRATESEFDRVKQGNSIAYVRSTFGTDGTITEYFDAPGNADDGVVVEWPTASSKGRVQMSFTKGASGTWKVDTRAAYWTGVPRQTADKATEAEFNQVKAGDTIQRTRGTFGTDGTIRSYYDPPGTADDAVTIAWPTPSPGGAVTIDLAKGLSGFWKVDGRRASWDRTAEPTEDLATRDEFYSVATTDSLSLARKLLGSPGTVVNYADVPGTADDLIEVAWYTGPDTGDVVIVFRNTADGWTIVDVDDMSGPWSGPYEPEATASSLAAGTTARPAWDLRDAG